jgi:CheY-like chemotaxis protein
VTRFEPKPTPLIYAGIAISLAVVLLADLYTPLGVTAWVFYLVPVVLCFLLPRSWAPVAVAALSTALLLTGFLLSPPGVDPWQARINRAFGILTVLFVAGVGRQFIINRLAVIKEKWLQSGQTQLSERMGGEQQLKELGQNALRFLCEYLDAQAGALFVEEDKGGFRRFATYAVRPESLVPERFAMGEGLPGQAAKDGRTILISDVPENYFSIGSSLGQSRPRHLLITPVAVDGNVNAVVELGFIHAVDGAVSELLERVSQSIAVAVRSSRYRTRLQELLEETQRQAEELQAQGEELRVSNEELAEQSNALKESQARLELQQTELEQTNTQLEEQTQLLEAQKEDLSRAKAGLEEKARSLDQVSRYKSDFLANMSHELRTPLNSSLILAKLLGENHEGNLTEEQVRYAQTIESSGNDLLALITDILDLSKIEAGRMEMRIERVPVERILDNLRRTFEPIAAQKSLGFGMQVFPEAPEHLETDPQRLEQVLKNLLSNAIKFSEKGEVNVEVSRTAEGKVAFAVRDTGIGIPEHQQEVIFEPFRQADGTTNRKYGGTGLGLSISRELARLLGGDIQLRSVEGAGSTFTLVVPEVCDLTTARRQPVQAPLDPWPASVREPAPAPEQLLERKAARSKARPGLVADDRERLSASRRAILVVEDEAPFAKILYDLAHELEFDCLIASTAEEGLSLAEQFVPSAVILDVGLPDNSGLTVLDRLKSDSRTRHIPVHVVSASDYAHKALSLGAVGYMLKPVSREQLVQAFEQIETKLAQRMRRVLVVEDDAVQLESVQRLLSSREVETVGARSAAECLEALRSATFDCMVLDLSLPDASGFSLLETLSQEEAYAFPPVIVYTGRELSSEEEQRLRKYSKTIIIKGAKSPERLLDEVALFLHQVVSELTAEQQKMVAKARHRDAALEGRRILIAEDDVRNVFALTSILEPRGAKVQIARNGREVLEALDRAQTDPDMAVDLVLMDIMMPEMDGLAAMREIRKRPEWRKLPIIALTAKAMKNDQEDCIAAGANDYMAKPLEVEKLLSLVRVWISR